MDRINIKAVEKFFTMQADNCEKEVENSCLQFNSYGQ